ncbi:MAG: DUF1987 domain-containing protein [Bacteroidales bacterium]|nr:DUF1987 domain-containing protein [Bacteroidales bacterium]
MIVTEGTKDTPTIKIIPDEWFIKISGPSYPPNALRVYQDVFNWIESLEPDPSKELKIDFNYTYLNSSSKSALMEILRKLESLVINNQKVLISWYFSSSDEDMEELGDELRSMFSIPFKLVSFDEE